MTKRFWFTTFYGVLLAIILLVVSAPSQAYSRFKQKPVADAYFSQLHVRVEIDELGTLQVTQQGVLVGGNYKGYGLSQDIKLRVNLPNGEGFYSELSLDSIKIDGKEARHLVESDYFRHDSEPFIKSKHLPSEGQIQQFEVQYTTKNRMRFYPELDELSYALFPDISVKIKQLTVSVVYPKTAQLLEYQLFVDNLKDYAFVINHGVIDGRNELQFESQYEIIENTQGEVALAFEKGVFRDTYRYTKVWRPFFKAVLITLPFLILFGLVVWRAPKRIHQLPKLADALPCSTKPPHLPIGLVRELVDANIERMLTAKDVLAEILKLAIMKRLTISERGKNNNEFSNLDPKDFLQIQLNPEAPTKANSVGLSAQLQAYFYQQQVIRNPKGKPKQRRVLKNRFVIHRGDRYFNCFTAIICEYVNKAEVVLAKRAVNIRALIIPILLWLSASFLVSWSGAATGLQVFGGSFLFAMFVCGVLGIIALIVETIIDYRDEDKMSRRIWCIRGIIYLPVYSFMLWMPIVEGDSLINGASVVFHFFYFGFIAACFLFIGPSEQYKSLVRQSQQFYQYIKLKSQHCFAEGVSKAEYEALLPCAYAFGLLDEWIDGYEAYLTAEQDHTTPLIPWIRYKKITELRELKQHLNYLEVIMPATSCSLYDRQPHT